MPTALAPAGQIVGGKPQRSLRSRVREKETLRNRVDRENAIRTMSRGGQWTDVSSFLATAWAGLYVTGVRSHPSLSSVSVSWRFIFRTGTKFLAVPGKKKKRQCWMSQPKT